MEDEAGLSNRARHRTVQREGLALQPGIPASVNIKTQERTLFDYLIAPLSDAFSRSMREE
jgi:hypothetical protein